MLNFYFPCLLLRIFLALTFLAAWPIAPALASSAKPEPAPWWDARFTRRAQVKLPEGTSGLVRVPLPPGAKASEIRCVMEGQDNTLAFWLDRLESSDAAKIVASPTIHYGFPRIVRAANGELLLFYRVGTTHAYDDAHISTRRSVDGGKTWGPERDLWQPPAGRSAHNPVALVTPQGRVVLWVSDYEYSAKPTVRRPCLWAVSGDHGETFSPFVRFDPWPERSTYYVTDAIATSEGLLAASATFPPGGVGNCHTPIWVSGDDGRTWKIRSLLTPRDANRGDEVGLLETEPGTILCLLRDRQRKHTYRFWSRDGGRTWSEPETLDAMLGCILQRPLLTRLDEKTVLLSGRDFGRKLVVVYLSRDNGRTFGARSVLDSFRRDGGYTAALRTGDDRSLMTWYADSGTTPLKPDLKSVVLKVVDRPAQLSIRIPAGTKIGPKRRLYVYFNCPSAEPVEDRTLAELHPENWVEGELGAVQTRER